MKKFLALTLIAVLMSSFITPAFAASNPGEKLVRGVVNFASAPLEVPKQIDVEWKAAAKNKDKVALGIASGLLKGCAFTIGRLLSGTWDIVSFPFQVPENYGPIMKPEFVFDKK